MYQPEFPYKNNQIILSSDRVVLHSKSDSIFLFGKQSVSLSSTKTINLDSNDKVLIDSPKIELGRKAEKDGEPVILGNTLNLQLLELINGITVAATLLKQVSSENPAVSAQFIQQAADILYNSSNTAKQYIDTKATLSKNTFTK
jgi:hypothetical protein